MNKEKALERLSSLEKEAKELRKIIETPDKPKNIMDRVKDLADSCIELGVGYNAFLASIEKLDEDTQAYESLKLITKALNEGEVLNTGGYAPYFDITRKPGSGFFSSGYRTWRADSGVSGRLAFKTKELALYAGKQFEELYYKFMVVK